MNIPELKAVIEDELLLVAGDAGHVDQSLNTILLAVSVELASAHKIIKTVADTRLHTFQCKMGFGSGVEHCTCYVKKAIEWLKEN